MEQWAKEHNLSEETLRKLVEDGYDSLEELSQLTPDEVDNYYAHTLLLKKAQCSRVKRALEALNKATTRTRGQNVTAKHPSSHGDPARTFQESAGMDSWAQAHKLTTGTLAKLREDGFDSMEELSQLKPDNVDKFYTDTNLLPKAQCLRLKKAVEALNNSSTQGQAMNPRNTGTHGSLGSRFQQSEAVIRFLLVGKTGVGKSTTGNTILGSQLFSTSWALSSKTSKCEVHSKFIFGVNVEVIDTPGLFDTSLGQAETGQVIAQGVACLHPGLHVFLVLVKIGRFTKEDDGAYKRLVAIFDESVSKYMIVVFTGGDGLSGKKINDLLETAPPSLKEIVKACENRYVVFDNTAADKKPQVKHLLQTAQELVEKNGNRCYSCSKWN